MDPVPITYVMAAVIGGVLGATLDLVLGWPWWLIAVGFLAAVWLFFLASAFWGPDPIRSDNVRDVIDPSGIEAREFARLEEAISTGQLLGMEVAGWTGSRSVGGWGGSSHPEHLTLRHGNPETDTAWVSVTARSSERDVARLEWRKDNLFRELLHSEEQPAEGLDVEDLRRWLIEQRRRIEETKPMEWSTTTLAIDGTPIPCDVLHRADRWVAMTVADGAAIEVMARGFKVDTVALNRVQNLQPYIQGTQQLNAARRREHGH
ncbi:MAG: hypothetical protein ACC654_10250 [Acidimicrobiia bacterium]